MLYWFINRDGRSDLTAKTGRETLKTYEKNARTERHFESVLKYSEKYEWDASTGRGARTVLYWRVVVHNLSYYWKAIRRGLVGKGKQDATEKRLTVENYRAGAGEFDYVVNDSGQCYMINIYIKKGVLQLINGDILTGDDGLSDINEMIALTEEIYDAAGADGLTLASVAYKSLKNSLNKYSVKGILRECDRYILPGGETEDSYIRPCFQGGFNLLKKSGAYSSVLVLDVNSLYPYIFSRAKLPTGKPKTGDGAIPDKILNSGAYCGYVRFKARLMLKKDRIPFIRAQQIKDRILLKTGAEILTHTAGRFIDLVLTFEEYKLMLEQYTAEIEPLDYIYYNAAGGIFTKWIDDLYEQKQTATGHRRTAVKMLLNSSIGGLSKKRERTNIYIREDGEQIAIESPVKAPSHIYIGAYVVSLARVKVIKDAQANFKRWIYSDTDSLHLEGTELPENLKIGGYEMGAYKIEHRSNAGAYYWAAKNYTIIEDNAYAVTAAGLPEEGRAVLEEMLNTGAKYETADPGAEQLFELSRVYTQRGRNGGRLTLAELDKMKAFIPVRIWTQPETWTGRRELITWTFDPQKAWSGL